MTVWNTHTIDQFWGLTEDLAIATSRWRESPSEDSAFYVALCAGHCQLFEVPQSIIAVEDLASKSNFVELFYVAWREGRRMIDLIVDECDDDDGLLRADGGIESRTLALDILQSRMLLQGFSLFLHDLQRSPGVAADTTATELFQQYFEVNSQLLERFDEAIDNHPEQLAIVADSAWPHNVRMTLSASAWQPRPWWLTDYANSIMECHRKFVQRLIDQRLAGMIVASQHICQISLAKPAKTVGLPQEAAELSLAADSNLTPSFVQLVEFQSEVSELILSTTVSVSSDYREAALFQIPVTVICIVQISVLENSPSKATEDLQQLWRLRWGMLIVDVQINKLASSLASEWIGNSKLSVGQLQSLVREDAWPQQHWRRLS